MSTMTRIIPTDRNGNPYYGPKTYAQAQAVLAESDSPLADEVVKIMNRAGYHGAAQRIANDYDLGKIIKHA